MLEYIPESVAIETLSPLRPRWSSPQRTEEEGHVVWERACSLADPNPKRKKERTKEWMNE